MVKEKTKNYHAAKSEFIGNFWITPGSVISNTARALLKLAQCLDLEIPHYVRKDVFSNVFRSYGVI